MDIKDKLTDNDSIYSDKPKKEFPDDFKENKEEIDGAEDLDIKDFIRKKKAQKDEKEEKKAPKQEQKEPIQRKEPVQTLKDKIPTAPEEQTQPGETERQSNLAKILTIYMTPDKVEATKQALQGAVNGNYAVAMQAGIQVTKENVEEVSSILKYLAGKGYLVVISGEYVEPIFHEQTK